MSNELNETVIREGIAPTQLIFTSETDSTNSQAKKIALDNEIELPFVFATRRQTSGRGQMGNRWWSDEGSLTFSIAIRAPQDMNANLATLQMANIIADTIEQQLSTIGVQLKWPNDLFVAGRKFGGILIESHSQASSDSMSWVIGIGLNLNCQIENASNEIRHVATSLNQHAREPINPNRMLIKICDQIVKTFHFETMEKEGVNTIDRFLSRSLFSLGCQMKVQLRGGEVVSGRFLGLGENAELVIQTDSETKHIVSATIIDYQDG